MASMYALNSKKKERNVRADIARRHVVSSDDIAKHYEKALSSPSDTQPLYPVGRQADDRTAFLDQRSARRGEVAIRPSKSEIQQAAVERHRKFFGYAREYFPRQ
jgi:hypothetical protein